MAVDPELQHAVGEWHGRMFPTAGPTRLVLKAVEEVGELAAAHNRRLAHAGKGEWAEAPNAGEIDGIGDVVIVLLALCDRWGLDLGEIVTATWQEVSARSAERIGE